MYTFAEIMQVACCGVVAIYLIVNNGFAFKKENWTWLTRK